MTRTSLCVLAAVAALLLSGCGSSEDAGDAAAASESPEPSESTSAPATPTPSPSPTEEAAGTEPNIGDLALRVGQTRKGGAFTTRVNRVRPTYPPGPNQANDPGERFFGVFITQCRLDNDMSRSLSDSESLSTYNGEWSVRDAQGNTYAGDGSSYSSWPSPKFPETRVLTAGDCRRGWITIEIPESVRATLLEYAPGGSPVAEWKLTR